MSDFYIDQMELLHEKIDDLEEKNQALEIALSKAEDNLDEWLRYLAELSFLELSGIQRGSLLTYIKTKATRELEEREKL